METLVNKLTNEEIARVFAMYLGAPIVPLSEACTIAKKEGGYNNWGIRLEGNQYQISFGKNLFPIEKYGLYLTPLDKITDEHAIEIANILDVPGDCVERHKDHIAVYDRYNDNANTIDTLRLHFINNYELLHLDELGRAYEFDLTRCSCIHQYLISKGYAVPLWFGVEHSANYHTAIELGIAIDNTLNP